MTSSIKPANSIFRPNYNRFVRKPVVLITGAGGEIGHGLIDRLAERGDRAIVTLDLNRLDASIGSRRSIARSPDRFSIVECSSACWPSFASSSCFISPRSCRRASEFTPVTAHQVNVEGTLNLLEFAQHEAESHGRPVVFMYPSSIAAYGLPESRKPRRPRGR